MSIEEAHKLIDKLFAIRYTGLISLSYFSGGISDVEHSERGIRSASQMVLMISETKK